MNFREKNFLLLCVLYPFSFLYKIVVCLRNKLFDYGILRSHFFDIPVITIGNITVGGTGKTPHIEYLIKTLKDQYKIAVLSRGYKRKTKNYILASSRSTSRDIGDEPRQIKKKFPDIEVAVERERVKGIKKLQQDIDHLEIVLLDDAFQHRYVKAGLTILIIDYNRPLFRDAHLPLGRLREHPGQRRRADIIILSKCPDTITPVEKEQWMKNYLLFPCQRMFFTTYHYLVPQPLFGTSLLSDEKPLENMLIMLVTGIANPSPLKHYLLQFSNQIETYTYPDHYDFNENDINKIITLYHSIRNNKKVIITTEKDATRLEKWKDEFEKNNVRIYYIPVEVKFLFNEQDHFNALLHKYVKSGKPFSSL